VTATIPFVDLRAQWDEVGDEVRSSFEQVHAATSYILGPQLEAFERDFADYLGVRHAIGTASGTDALALALQALGVGPGDEVLVPAMTFIATAEAVALCGARPVLVDVDPATGLVLPEAVEAAAGPRTAALLAVHLYGQPADLEILESITQRLGIALVEDACQAHGARYGQRRVGGFGQAAAFSFYPSKNLGAYGDGGCVTSNDQQVAARVRSLRDHGTSSKYVHQRLSGTVRLDTLQAAALTVKLPRLDGWNQARVEHAERYGQALAGLKGLELPVHSPGRSHVWHLYTVRLDQRDAVREALSSRGIASGIHYPIALHQQPALAELGQGEGSMPGAERIAATTLSLPMYPELKEEAPARVAAALEEILS
jgi:dTDP-4-amino-4,6-dideoxygalactose transaminase